MNEDSFSDKLTRFGLWVVVLCAVVAWVGILMAPCFLPAIRHAKTMEYEKFLYKDDLVKEAMTIYTRWAWGLCIGGWGLTISYLLFVGL